MLQPAEAMTKAQADLLMSGETVDGVDRFLADPDGTGVRRGRPRRQRVMSLEPLYSSAAATTLDGEESDPARSQPWNAICDAIDLICDRPDSAEARRTALRTRDGNTVWQVAVRGGGDWVVLGFPRPPDALIAYIDTADFRS
ncbi:hypothetical protein [Phytoactinopolyspora halotolerans]|uniref:Uncharacterized protein n=1 Tax=Phytoactinopolyspora halotolerans TaxID=1981512 RepID=A0A6L9SGB0_9ACTN|nr:hypothetical protein [Phytoactinopolyspora halotolerans]NEE03120.1 hypothetical protein [Phytoactinopolyspora halotolerans]